MTQFNKRKLAVQLMNNKISWLVVIVLSLVAMFTLTSSYAGLKSFENLSSFDLSKRVEISTPIGGSANAILQENNDAILQENGDELSQE